MRKFSIPPISRKPIVKVTLLNLSMITISASNFIFRNKVRVLFYHRVNDYSGKFAITAQVFERQIQYLKKEYNIISLNEYINMLENNQAARNALLITFDDGYRDNYTNAYPILKRYSIPATIFLATGFIDNKIWIWHDIYRYIIENTPRKTLELKLDGHEYLLNLENPVDRLNARKFYHRSLKELPASKRVEQLRSIAEMLNVEVPAHPTREYAPLSWDEINEMSRNKIEFGAHTYSHEILSKLKTEDAYYEVSESKRRIEAELQMKVSAFAYPNGTSEDFTEETKMLVRRCGYRVAFTTINGMNDRNTDRFSIKRISAGNKLEEDFFFKQISGINIIKEQIMNLLTWCP